MACCFRTPNNVHLLPEVPLLLYCLLAISASKKGEAAFLEYSDWKWNKSS